MDTSTSLPAVRRQKISEYQLKRFIILFKMLNLKEIRKKYNKKQAELAAYLGISQGNISDMENGKYEPDIYKILKMAEFFGITTDELLGVTPKRLGLTAEQQNLLYEYEELDEYEKKTVLIVIKGFINDKAKK